MPFMAMAAGSEYPAGQRSRRSSLSKGKPCTWQRETANIFNTINGKCVRHYERSRKSIKQSGAAK